MTLMFSMNLIEFDNDIDIDRKSMKKRSLTMNIVGTRHVNVSGLNRIGSTPDPTRISQFHSVKLVNKLEEKQNHLK